jgi:N-acyl-D-amino-acid deacylase
LVITEAKVADGTGAPLFLADVVIDGGRIAGLDEPGSARGKDMIAAGGSVVCPGFIDMHSHSDLQVLVNPDHPARLLQGITTEVMGQDGLSYAPVDDVTLQRLQMQLAGWNDNPAGFDWGWRTVAGYLQRLGEGIAVNAAYLVPHGNLRLLVMGAERRPPSPAELEEMCRVLRESLRSGAVGMSAGLTYSPGMYADFDEIAALCRVVADEGGYYCPHHRNYGLDALSGYGECLEVARLTGVALHLAHTHLSFPVNEGKLGELLGMFDDAVAAGVDLSFDSYPYLAGMTSLHACLPSWIQEGDLNEQLARLQDPAVRERVRAELDITGTDGNQGLPVDWDTIVVSGCPPDTGCADAVGRSIADSARSRGVRPADFFLDVVIASRMSASCLMHFGIEDHVRRLMQHERHMVGSDGILVGQQPHPRAWGAFARMLGRYVREEGILELEECIRHMTSAPADRVGLRDRGRVAAGAWADLVVFDPDIVLDQATYESPRQPPVGIHHVLVNGVPAVRDGALTGRHAGRVLRSANPNEENP